MCDPWWSPAAEDQASDRIHRMGQTLPVCIMRLVAKDSVEECIVELQDKKRELAAAALGATKTRAELARLREENMKLVLNQLDAFGE